MANWPRGSTYNWPAIIRDGSGSAVDPDDLTLTVFEPGGDIEAGFPVAFGSIVRDGLGLYHYPWAIPSDADTGLYSAAWSGTLDGAGIEGTDELNVTLPGAVETPSESIERLYLGPGRFRSMRTGVSLTGISDLQLVDILADASAEVDSYCQVATRPEPFSFLGGRVIDEQHVWRYPVDDWDNRATRKLFLTHKPIVELEAFRLIIDGSANGSEISPEHFVIDNQRGLIELGSIALTAGGPFGVPAFLWPMSGLEQPLAYVTYTYGYGFDVVDERLYATGTTGEYQAQNPHWSTETVKVDGALVDSGDYTVDRLEGRVTFSSAPDGDSVVTASYRHRLPREIPRATAQIAAYMLSQASLQSKGMALGIRRVQVAEISIERASSRAGASGQIADLSQEVPAAARLLAGFRHIWIR